MSRICNGWTTATQPHFVSGPAQAPQHVAPHVKQRQADELAAAVAAHLEAGGAFHVLDGTPAQPAPRRSLGY